MRKADIKPGVLYAYKHFGPRDVPEPIMFFSSYPWLGTLYRAPLGRGGETRPFVRARPGDKPVSGHIYNDGTIGYPAVRLWGPPSDRGCEKLLAVTLRDFESATSTHDRERGIEFLVVPRLATVVCKWEDREQ